MLEAQKVPLHQMNYASYFGTGKIEELGAAIRAANYNVVYIDAFLNPAQVQKLSQRWVEMSGRELRVVDRFAVILEIFSIRAQSRESKLQVELAWIEYQRTFLVGKHSQEFKGEHQRGGRGFTSGSGETQLEIDRRRLSDRAAHVKKQLQTIAQTQYASLRLSPPPPPVPHAVRLTRGGAVSCTCCTGRGWRTFRWWRWWATPTWASRCS